MDAATGPPEKMAGRRDELTPMMGQYFDLCEEYPDSLVLFQVGDFYEAFCEAAERVSRLLDITLTKREDSTGEYPMAGIPIDNAESYVETLLSAGYRVAIADQVQDPEEATGVVDRAVTRVVTPGTLTEDELLDGDDNNYVASIAGEYALALMDVSTGEFAVTSVDTTTALRNELGRIGPSEIVLGPDVSPDLVGDDAMVTPFDEAAFDADRARETVAAYFADHDEVLADEDERRACGALLSYAEYARSGEQDHLDYLNELRRYDPAAFVRLDEVAIESLELFDRRTVHGDDDGTLFGVIDETACALGSRKLKEWLRRPLVDADDIEARLDAVDELTGLVRSREALHDALRDVYDIERLIGRVSRGRANARDLLALKRTLDVVPDVRTHLADVDSDRLRSLRGRLDEMSDVRNLVDSAIREDPPQEITEGDVIAPGYDEDLDALRETEREGREWVADLEETERDRTGIDSLKVGYNEVHGYYIEVTKPNLDRVPDDYTRRQTLKNSERFYTPELKQREDEILRAEQQADTLEHRLFREVREEVAAESERVQRLARALAELDALVALAEVAVTNDYCRPSVGADGVDIVGGRHPVVEHAEARFVPNDADLTDERLAVVTGPNMSGKSTYMRQVALICILAQMGSFVPAERARLPVLDRVFTRIGASDDIAGGRSTFMIEMAELTDILREATADSMVLLDEVGRGTSTADGLAIARAVTEYLHDEVGSYTLFATHHHDLTRTAAALPGAYNLHFDADREAGDVVFTHRIERGASSSSYGVEVADMAGVPDAVVERSRELLAAEPGVDPDDAGATANEGATAGDTADTAADDAADAAAPETAPASSEDGGTAGTGSTGDRERVPPAVAERLREANVAETTPLEALELLSELKRSLDT